MPRHPTDNLMCFGTSLQIQYAFFKDF
jgi:hypothetical protein